MIFNIRIFFDFNSTAIIKNLVILEVRSLLLDVSTGVVLNSDTMVSEEGVRGSASPARRPFREVGVALELSAVVDHVVVHFGLNLEEGASRAGGAVDVCLGNVALVVAEQASEQGHSAHVHACSLEILPDVAQPSVCNAAIAC